MPHHLVQALICLATVEIVYSQDPIGGLSGNHVNIARWCGKAYMAGSPNFDPGGMLQPPSGSDALQVQIKPLHSIYVSSETSAAFIVSASQSSSQNSSLRTPHDTVNFDIRLTDSNSLLLRNSVSVNADASTFTFDIKGLQPQIEPYNIVLYGSQTSTHRSFAISTELYYLPAKTSGSMVKIDNLNGGMLVANNATDFAFQPLLPFGFYTSCSDYLQLSSANVTAYKNMGFNAINPVCAFTDGDIGYLYDWLDEANLWYQYDMRNSFLNLSSVAEQIPLIKDRSAFLSWYTADEPDGWQYALNSTKLAYDLLKREDPYHPTGLVLNCQNYYFGQYSAGADYIMEDAYPVGINGTFSRPYGIPCNETYGDCGCDNCIGELQDVSDRLDDFDDYQEWLGEWPKPLWAVLQAFSGEGYWSRDPTAQESWVMMLLGLNHRAKGIMSWDYPPSSVLAAAHGEMAKIVTARPASDFILDGQPAAVEVADYPSLDVAYWAKGEQILLSLANSGNSTLNGTVSIHLPAHITGVKSQLWGNLSYSIGASGNLQIQHLPALGTSLAILEQ